MKWEDIKIEEIAVDLYKGYVSINQGLLILTADKYRKGPMQIVYAVAHATKYPPDDLKFKGLTWTWLKEKLKGHSEFETLCKGDNARVVWNQACLDPTYWRINCRAPNMESWFDKGIAFLEKLFISEPIHDDQKYLAHIKGPAHRVHLPDNVVIELNPDGLDLPSLLMSVNLKKWQSGPHVVGQKHSNIQDKVEAAFMNKTEGSRKNNGVDKSTLIAGIAHEAGLYNDARSAIHELALKLPDVEEVVFVAYTAKLLAEDLRTLGHLWQFRCLCVLLRDMDAIDTSLIGEIPRLTTTVVKRRQEIKDNIDDIKELVRDIVRDPVEFRYYRSQPCLRGLLVREHNSDIYSAGFFSIYRQRVPGSKSIDYGGRMVPLLRLSLEHPYEKVLLDSFASWFRFVWKEGSYPKQI